MTRTTTSTPSPSCRTGRIRTRSTRQAADTCEARTGRRVLRRRCGRLRRGCADAYPGRLWSAVLTLAAFRGHERPFRLARLSEEPGRHRGHARPRPTRATAWSTRPRAPTSSSSTPARSSTRPRRSRRHDPRDGPPQEGGDVQAAGRHRLPRAALREGARGEIPEIDQFLGSDEVGAIAKAIAGTIDAAGGRRDARLHLRPRGAARPLAGGAQRVRQDRRGLRSAVRVLHHPEAARPAAQPHARVGRREARDLVAGGAREINLIAQDLTSYGTDLPA